MNPIVEYLTGMDSLTDQVVATDLLLSAKTGILNYAMAVTEASTLEVKAALRRQLDYEIQVHEQISSLIESNGWAHPYNIPAQAAVNNTMTKTTLNLPIL